MMSDPIKTSRVHRAAPLVLATLLFGACASAPEPHPAQRKGDDYFARDSYHLALPYYQEAAAARPDDEALQKRLTETREALLAHRRAQARGALDAGEPEAALAAAIEVQAELGADDPEVEALVEEIGQRVGDHAASAERAGDHQEAVRIFEALLRDLPEHARGGHSELARLRKLWVGQLIDRALDDEEQRLWASAMLTWAEAAHIGGEPAHAKRRDELYARVIERNTYRLRIGGDTMAPPQARMLQELERRGMPGAAALTEDRDQATATLELAFSAPRCEETTSKRQRTASASARAGGGLAAPIDAGQPIAYVVTRHERRCQVRFEATVRPTDRRVEPTTITRQFSTHTTDESHPAVPEAGLTADPLALDTPETLRRELFGQGVGLAYQALERDVARHRQGLTERARKIPLERARLDAEITAVLLEPAHATPRRMEYIRRESGFEDASHILLMNPSEWHRPPQ